MIHKSIEVPLYHQRIQIIVCDDAEKEIDQINKKYPSNIDRFEFSGYAEGSGKYNLIVPVSYTHLTLPTIYSV